MRIDRERTCEIYCVQAQPQIGRYDPAAHWSTVRIAPSYEDAERLAERLADAHAQVRILRYSIRVECLWRCVDTCA